MLRLIILLAAVSLNHVLTSAVNVSIPTTPPYDSQPLSRTLLSFSLEQDRWPDWSGTTSRNEFVHSAFLTLGDLTGQPPKIRVGADSEDLTTWSPAVAIEEAIFPSPNNITPYPVATAIEVGDAYYTLSRYICT